MALAVVFAVASAFSNAIALVGQHLASITAPRPEERWGLVRYLIRQPMWMLGWVGAIGAFAFQALALHFGLLSVVQPLLVTELVFVLVLRWLWIGQDIAGSAWAAAVVVCASLAVFLGLAEPTGGTASPSTGDWLSALIAFSVVIAALAVSGIQGPPAQRAAVFAAAGSLTWALMATFVKTATQILASAGFVGLLENWSPYALAASAIVGTLLEQAALHVGPLSISEPLLVVINPLASVGLSVWVFNEQFTANPVQIAVAFGAFAVMTAGVVWLSRAAPRNIVPVSPASTQPDGQAAPHRS